MTELAKEGVAAGLEEEDATYIADFTGLMPDVSLN